MGSELTSSFAVEVSSTLALMDFGTPTALIESENTTYHVKMGRNSTWIIVCCVKGERGIRASVVKHSIIAAEWWILEQEMHFKKRDKN